jgi:CRP-like cAMP-binding protein
MNADKIRHSIDSIISLSAEEWMQLSAFIEVLSLKKNSFFLSEGQICDSIAFVNAGMLIYSKSLKNGGDITTDFAFKGDWVTDNYSRLNQTPSFLNIKAIEDSELIIIKQENLPTLFSKIPQFERLGRVLMEQAFIKIAQHSIDLQSFSAKERYSRMLQKYPEVFQKIPLYHIANYLGIAPKSLSRIRNEIFHKP